MSDVSGTLLCMALLQGFPLYQTVLRTVDGLWTFVPPAGSTTFNTPATKALAWGLAASRSGRFARLGPDVSGASMLAEVWRLGALTGRGGRVSGTLVRQDAFPAVVPSSFTPPAGPVRNANTSGNFFVQLGQLPSASLAISDSPYLAPIDGSALPGVVGYDTQGPATPAGQVDWRMTGFSSTPPPPPVAFPGSHVIPYVWVPYSFPGFPAIKFAIYSFENVGNIPTAPDFPEAPNPTTNPNLWTGISLPGGSIVSPGAQTVTFSPPLSPASSIRHDEAADETVAVLWGILRASWYWFETIPITYTVQLYGGGSASQTGRILTMQQQTISAQGLRVARNGLLVYDDFAGPLPLATQAEGPYPSSGQSVVLSAPVSRTLRALDLVALVPLPLARAGGDFAVLWQNPTARGAAELVTSTGSTPLPQIPLGGVGQVELSERGGRLWIAKQF